MVRCGRQNVLPRPFSIFRAYGGDLAIFYNVWEDGMGTEWLAGRHTNDEVQIFGPLGKGYEVSQSSKNLLLVAGGMGIAPIYYLLQQAIARKLSVTLLYGTENRNRYPMPPEIKHIQATEDGSIGHKGTVNDLIEQNIDKADQVFMCGPLAMYSDLIKRKSELRLEGKSIQVSLEVRMGCGTGVCYGCTIKTINGLKQVCKDGPVFNLHEVIWESLLT
jgi:dihydroorotate dehydrogenase electron transfer subunit